MVRKSCKFAVRGGGHGTADQVANIEGGITIDLRGINSIQLNQDRSRVFIGGAATLGNVYTYLAQYGVSIPGARAAGIGIGGSTLGGKHPKSCMCHDQQGAHYVDQVDSDTLRPVRA